MAAALPPPEVYPIVLGPSLDEGASSSRPPASSFVSVKYNFKPPSIRKDAAGYMRCPTKSNAEWILEYATTGPANTSAQQPASGASASAQGFVGAQTPARSVDCILVWDRRRKAYVLDRLASTMSMKFDRNYNKLSSEAEHALTRPVSAQRGAKRSIEEALDVHRDEDESSAAQPPFFDDDDFARQLEQGLAEIDKESPSHSTHTGQEEARASRETSPKRARTRFGLGLVGAGLGQQLEGITPRASPQIDRPSKVSGASAFAHVQTSSGQGGAAMTPTHSTQLRGTSHFSPASLTNSPRLAPVNHETSLSSTWKPPAQRTAIAIPFDDDDEEDDEEEDDDDDDDDDDEEEDEEEDEEDDLEAFARQLEGTLADSSAADIASAASTKGGPSAGTRTRRASARGK